MIVELMDGTDIKVRNIKAGKSGIVEIDVWDSEGVAVTLVMRRDVALALGDAIEEGVPD